MAARWDVARVVRSLIIQTNDRATVDMRAGEGSEVPGYDGIVDASIESFFVPAGHSVWELGTSEDPGDKASDDYALRTNDSLGEDKGKTTFVFVTPRWFKKKREWIKRKKKGSPWLDIRVYDADDLETALEQAPGTHYIFSHQLGHPALGVRSLEEWWKKFASVSNPALTDALALAGREAQAAALLPILQKDIGRTTISGASPDDVLAFVASSISSSDEDQRLDLFSRCLIVHDAHALRVLDRSAKLLILLPYDETLQREAELIQSHHVVLLALRAMPATVTVGDLDQEKFAEILRTAGVAEMLARDLARAASRSLVAFQRLASAPDTVLRREWNDWFKSQVIRRAWLAGGWVEVRSGDSDVMRELVGHSLDEAGGELREAAAGEDPLFVVVANVWGIASPDASWDYMQTLLTGADLSALERAVQAVLGAIDPRLDLPLEQRWQASIYGKSRVHSSNLRLGLATTLALLGALGHSAKLGGGATARTWAEQTVAQLLQRANDDQSGKLWTSLSDIVPLLAEAAPAQFLRAVQKGTTGTDPLLVKLFTDKDAGFATTSAHPGLLWALEGLAWSPEYFALAVDALARLAELDPDGRFANRPAASLLNVFRPWMPQTLATPEARLTVLDSLVLRHRRVAWSLLRSLLPEMHGVGTYAHEPRFRTWKKEMGKVTMKEYWQVVDGVLEDMLSIVAESPDLWPDLIEHLPNLPKPKRAEIYERLVRLGDDEQT